MHFTLSTSLCTFVLIFAQTYVKADVIAFSGSTCDGAEGSNVACQDQCIHSANRHSALVVAQGAHCLTFFEDGGCSINVGSVVNSGGGSCTNINTGTNVQSFKCSPNSACSS